MAFSLPVPMGLRTLTVERVSLRRSPAELAIMEDTPEDATLRPSNPLHDALASSTPRPAPPRSPPLSPPRSPQLGGRTPSRPPLHSQGSTGSMSGYGQQAGQARSPPAPRRSPGSGFSVRQPPSPTPPTQLQMHEQSVPHGEDLERFAEICRRLYFDKDDDAGASRFLALLEHTLGD